MTKDNPQMVQALRDRVGLSEDDAKRTVEIVDEVLSHEHSQQPKAAELRLGDRNPFKDAVVTERTGYLRTPAIFERLGRFARRKRHRHSATV